MIENDISLWDDKFSSVFYWRCITTNGVIDQFNCLVMGKGVALDAKKRYPGLSAELGKFVREFGNVPKFCSNYRIISFPTKSHWRYNSDLDLIQRSAETIAALQSIYQNGRTYVVLPKVGCGNGGLDWDTQVRPLLAPIFNDHFIVAMRDK